MQSGPPGAGKVSTSCQRLQVDLADGVGHAVAHEHVAPVTRGAEGMRARAGLDRLGELGLPCRSRRRPRRSRRRSGRPAGSCRRACRTRRPASGRSCTRHVSGLAWQGRPPPVRRCPACVTKAVVLLPSIQMWLGVLPVAMRLTSLRLLAVPAVDVDVVEPVAGGDEPLHVRREAQVVGIDDAAHRALDLGRAGIDEGQRVGQRVGHDDRLLVGRHVQVVRLLAGGQALDLLPVLPGRPR